MKPIKASRFTGINNRVPPDRLPVGEDGWALADASNVDLTAAGTLQTRAGVTEAIEAENCRSLFSVDAMGALAAVGSNLVQFTGSAFANLATLASPFARVAYTKTPMGVVWSDGFTMNMVRVWVNGPLLPSTPNPTPAVSVASGGSLIEGTYGVSFAAVMPDGRRSAMTIPVYVDVPAAGRIEISSPAQAYPVNVYVSAPNGEVFYRCGRFQSGAFSVGTLNQDGESMVYEVMDLLPAGRVLGYHDGRLLSAVGAYLFYSQPYSLGLHKPASDYIPFKSDIKLIASLSPGVLIVATEDEHWRISGEINQATAVQIAPYGAVEGTMAEVPNSKSLMWFTPRGQLRAGQDGSIELLQDAQIQFPTAPLGAGVFRETNGMRQYIASLSQPVPSGAAVARSFMDARVIE